MITATQSLQTIPERQALTVRRPRKSRRGRPSKLKAIMRDTPEVYQKILECIRAGAAAAQALGIWPETFSRWLSRGRKERRGVFRQFYQDVSQAQAQARVVAEIKVYRTDPKFWLRCGGGRTRWEVFRGPDGQLEQYLVEGWTETPPPPLPLKPPAPEPCPTSPQKMAEALQAMVDIGLIQVTERGRELLDRSAEDGQGG
jgi:hypothetical protein